MAISGSAHAATESPRPITSITPVEDHFNITGDLEWLLDTTRKLTFDQAQAAYDAGDFEPWIDPTFSQRPRRAAVWVRARIHNKTTTDHYILELSNPRMPEVDFYVPHANGEYRHSIAGTKRPYFDREILFVNSSAHLRIPPGETAVVFTRVMNNGDQRFQLRVWTSEAFFNHANLTTVTSVFISGLLLALLAFNFVVLLSIREINYLYLTLFLGSWMLWYWAFTGLGSVFLWDDAPALANRAPTLFTFLVCAVFGLFTNSLLGIRRHAPYWSNVLMGYAIVCLAGMGYALISNGMGRIYFAIFTTVLGPCIMIPAALSVLGRVGSTARQFLLTWCAVHLGGITFIVAYAYFVTQEGFGADWLSGIVIASTLLWTFHLTGRVKQREAEQRAMLEQKVDERTRELTGALADVKQLSGLLPICASCKNIRDDKGYWSSVEAFVAARTDADFTHGVCPDCKEKLYPGI